MSGADIAFWLSELWFDVTHPATSDIPSLLFRLFVLFAVIVIAQHIIRVVLRVFGDILRPVAQLVRDILAGVWWVITAPVWIPYGWISRFGEGRRRKRRLRDEALQRERIEAERQRQIADDAQDERSEFERMRQMLSPLE